MPTTTRTACPCRRPPGERPTPPVRGLGLVKLAVALLLAGYLVFAHGCHGDEDNELWTRLQALVPGR